ncbi:hypothetical protein [Burkholderia contaminans]|uniref:DUF1906 domain-containing protein n=1 Tax=Burkholderia contaminans TaxID=488447 RepID=A0AAP4R9L8_9BURK|nr:hypothetical protein [Burkholderia contaminans]MDN7569963.1 hypothetical protein [Burkholderia contaminans]
MSIVGVDTNHPATASLIDLATNLLGNRPAFWGRYFKGPHNPSPIQYQAGQESSLLFNSGIRVLCIARQTLRVGGSASDGTSDAIKNMAAIVDSFGLSYLKGLGIAPLIFLDVEPDTPLSAEYFTGWSAALLQQGPGPLGQTQRFTPAIYINHGDSSSWTNLSTAIGGGATCFGAWVARYGSRTGAEGPPPWVDSQVQPDAPVAAPCPIVGWQYAGDYEDVLDFSTTPPNDWAERMLELLIPPSVPS